MRLEHFHLHAFQCVFSISSSPHFWINNLCGFLVFQFNFSPPFYVQKDEYLTQLCFCFISKTSKSLEPLVVVATWQPCIQKLQLKLQNDKKEGSYNKSLTEIDVGRLKPGHFSISLLRCQFTVQANNSKHCNSKNPLFVSAVSFIFVGQEVKVAAFVLACSLPQDG